MKPNIEGVKPSSEALGAARILQAHAAEAELRGRLLDSPEVMEKLMPRVVDLLMGFALGDDERLLLRAMRRLDKALDELVVVFRAVAVRAQEDEENSEECEFFEIGNWEDPAPDRGPAPAGRATRYGSKS
jgi:hypothetical protein